MDLRKEWIPLLSTIAVFLGFFFFPVGSVPIPGPVTEALQLAKWYAREHVLLCLVPAFFIAGAVSVFVSHASVMKYLGSRAPKVLAYGVASISGTVLAVCSCTILPLFAGIYRMGAGLGPATAFLYAGPAVNILAIILTARVLGPELGIARAVGAIVFSVVIGLVMHALFREGQDERTAVQTGVDGTDRPLVQTAAFIALQVGILVFATWGSPQKATGLWAFVYAVKWPLVASMAAALGVVLVSWYSVRWWKVALASVPAAMLPVLAAIPAQASPGSILLPVLGNPQLVFSAGVVGLSVVLASEGDEAGQWLNSSWTLAKQIFPLLLIGVLIAGFLLGRPGEEGIIPSVWVSSALGGNSLLSNLFASVAGAFMYFATLTEVPILQGLMGSGMGKGPALALLLAGPALSLPNMIVIRSVMGTKKTAVFVLLVVIMATVSGMIFGALF